jgi:tetratricopeptide (TPR) repeat protein
VIAAAVVVALVGGGHQRAAAAEDRVEMARRHYRAGEEAYRAGDYARALTEFEAGYALSPRPEFLLNFAQTYRRLERRSEAIVQCERFLAAAPTSPLAPEARRLLETLREERARLGDRAPPPSAPPATTPATTTTTTTVAPEVASPQPATSVAPAAAPRRRWVWAVLGVSLVAAVGLGVGLGLGLGLGSTGERFPDAPLGRVDFGR